MKKSLLTASLLPLMLNACGEAEEPAPVEVDLTEYSAGGTEPGWSVELKDGQLTYSSAESSNDFTVPLNKVTKVSTGWIVNGFTDKDNLRLEIQTGVKCNDGMSDREYADTVQAAVSEVGYLNGCGGDYTETVEAEAP